jgi:hybrid cluster-associated redox disulfide protein
LRKRNVAAEILRKSPADPQGSLYVTSDPGPSLEQLFRTWPEAAPLFMQRGMLCPACPFAPFHDIADACREYGLDPDALTCALQEVIGPLRSEA